MVLQTLKDLCRKCSLFWSLLYVAREFFDQQVMLTSKTRSDASDLYFGFGSVWLSLGVVRMINLVFSYWPCTILSLDLQRFKVPKEAAPHSIQSMITLLVKFHSYGKRRQYKWVWALLSQPMASLRWWRHRQTGAVENWQAWMLTSFVNVKIILQELLPGHLAASKPWYDLGDICWTLWVLQSCCWGKMMGG